MSGATPLGRRRFLAAGGLAALGLAATACGRGTGDGAPARRQGADPAVGLQQAIDGMARAGGGIVEVPASTVFVERSLVVPSGVDLHVRGSVLRDPAARGVLVTLLGDGCTVRGFEGGVVDGNRAQSPEESDVVQVVGSRCTVVGLTVRNSARNGIAIFSSRENRVEGCRITNCRDNGIIVADRGADANLLIDNQVSGTDRQNGIFVTASAGSTPTPDFVRDNRIVGNDVSGVGDTGIESGIHTVNTLIADNTVVATVNPGILLRDCSGVQVVNSTVFTTPGTLDAFAVVPQTQPSAVPVASTFTDCSVIGNASRAGFYVDSTGVAIRRARLLRAPTPQPLRGSAILTGAVDDLEVLEPIVESWQEAFTLNYATTPATLRAIRVLAPRTYRIEYLYSALGARLVDCILEIGQVDALTVGVFERNEGTILDGASRVGPIPPGTALAPGVDASLPPRAGAL